jgi:hypothetical protein
MPKHKHASGDDALREFYQGCRLRPKVIERAIRQRHEVPLNFAARERAIAAAMATRARWRNSKEAEG